MLINCRQATRLLSDEQDVPLPADERIRLGIHLLTCKGSRNYREQMRFLRTACRSLQQDRPEEGNAAPPR